MANCLITLKNLISTDLSSYLSRIAHVMDQRSGGQLLKQKPPIWRTYNTGQNSSSANMMDRFGYGNHVCPGRFLAVRGLKIIFAVLLVDYEVNWKRSDGKAPEMVMEGLSFPDPSQKITIKRRISQFNGFS